MLRSGATGPSDAVRVHFELEHAGADKPLHVGSAYEAHRRAKALVREGKGPVRIFECTRVKYHNIHRVIVAVLT
jgi:hypothetical protein